MNRLSHQIQMIRIKLLALFSSTHENKLWYRRNMPLEHTEVFLFGADFEYIMYDNNVYIDDKDIDTDQLSRLGFVGMSIDDVTKLKTPILFLNIWRNKERNIVLTFVDTVEYKTLKIAKDIVNINIGSDDPILTVFNILTKEI